MKALLILLLAIFCYSCSVNNIDSTQEEFYMLTAQNDSVENKPTSNGHVGINDWKTDSTQYETNTHVIN